MDHFVKDFENPDKIDTSVFDSINDYNEMVALGDCNDFRVFHNNIRSINKNFDQLFVLLICLFPVENFPFNDERNERNPKINLDKMKTNLGPIGNHFFRLRILRTLTNI
ncbi:hypothetical protein HHI36_010240 [Cryptolaemus montrouzieri]|uniref:Uncharacterized protein n=1 Tax=Cryptolaemus montrouzieri TaxID=559131 RepID=A0ABD2MI55_9CUCU